MNPTTNKTSWEADFTVQQQERKTRLEEISSKHDKVMWKIQEDSKHLKEADKKLLFHQDIEEE